jgi:hypothetical protein
MQKNIQKYRRRKYIQKHWRIHKTLAPIKSLADAKTLAHGKMLAPTEMLAFRKN